MTKITRIAKPEDKNRMDYVQRFQWWKGLYFKTYSIMIVILIIPLYSYYKGDIISGIRFSILFYLFLMVSIRIARKITKGKDEEFLKSQNAFEEKPKRWWNYMFKYLFLGLQIWILYIMYRIWMMTVGG